MELIKLTKAQKLQAQGALEEAKTLFEELLFTSPKMFDALHGLGIIEAQLGNMDKALLFLEQASPPEQKKGLYYLHLGHIYRNLKKIDKAIDSYQKAQAAGFNSLDLHLWLANLYNINTDTNAALCEFDAALKLNPASIEAHYQLGLHFLKTRSYDFANVQFNNVLALDPKHINAIFHSGVCALYAGKLKKAQRALDKVLTLDPHYLEAWVNLGVIALKNNQGQEAINNFTTALTLNPAHIPARSNLAATFMHYSRHENALTHYLILLEQEPHNVDYLYNSAVAEMTLGQYENANTRFLAVLARNPNHFDTLYNLGLLASRRKDAKHVSIKYLSCALTVKPNDPSCIHLLNSLTNKESSNTIATEHSLRLFDQYAAYYDKHLLQTLNYRLPFIIGSLLQSHHFNRSLDLGCGTGLCGEIIRPMTDYLVGVDLSLNMIERAKEKNCYDECITAEALDYLKKQCSYFNLIIAADLFPYLGKLDEYFAMISRCLEKNGSFIFTVEISQHMPWVLQETARFSHNVNYIHDLCKQCDLTIITSEIKHARTQAGKPTAVQLLWVRKNPIFKSE